MKRLKIKILRGCVNFIYLLFSFKIISYFKTEKQILRRLSKYKDNKILLISGGNSLYSNIALLNQYDLIAINSYNTYERLPVVVKEKINDKVFFFYQAPFHYPLSLESYQNSVNNILQNINKRAISVYNITGSVSYCELGLNNFEFRVISNLHYFGKHVHASSGVLSMLSFLELAGFKNIDLLGADFNWIPYEGVKNANELLEVYESLLSFFKHFYRFKKYLDKKGVVINHLVDDALLNLN